MKGKQARKGKNAKNEKLVSTSNAPKGWRDLQSENRSRKHSLEHYGLPPAQLIFESGDSYIGKCGERFIFYNEIADYVGVILESTTLGGILKVLPDFHGLETTDLNDLRTDEIEKLFGTGQSESQEHTPDWTNKPTKLGTVEGVFSKLGLAPAEKVLCKEKNEEYIVKRNGIFYYWYALTDVVDEVLAPKTFAEIYEYLLDGRSIETKRLRDVKK